MRSLALLTSIGPNMNLDWFRLSVRSVKTVQTPIHWLIGAPHEVSQDVERVIREEGADESVQIDLSTMHTGNIAYVRNTLAKKALSTYVMQFDCDDVLVGAGVDLLVEKTSSRGMKWGGSPIVDFNEETSPVHPVPDMSRLRFRDGVIPRKNIPETRRALRHLTPVGVGVVHPGACIIRKDQYSLVGGHDEVLGNRWEDYTPFVALSTMSEGAWTSIPSMLYRNSPTSILGTPVPDTSHEYYDDYLTRFEDAAESLFDSIQSGDDRIENYNLNYIRKMAGLA